MNREESLIVECPTWKPKNDISTIGPEEVKIAEPAGVSGEIRPCPDFIPVYNPRDY